MNDRSLPPHLKLIYAGRRIATCYRSLATDCCNDPGSDLPMRFGGLLDATRDYERVHIGETAHRSYLFGEVPTWGRHLVNRALLRVASRHIHEADFQRDRLKWRCGEWTRWAGSDGVERTYVFDYADALAELRFGTAPLSEVEHRALAGQSFSDVMGLWERWTDACVRQAAGLPERTADRLVGERLAAMEAPMREHGLYPYGLTVGMMAIEIATGELAIDEVEAAPSAASATITVAECARGLAETINALHVDTGSFLDQAAAEARIRRAIDKKLIVTNGKTGRARRIDPASFAAWLRLQERAERAEATAASSERVIGAYGGKGSATRF